MRRMWTAVGRAALVALAGLAAVACVDQKPALRHPPVGTVEQFCAARDRPAGGVDLADDDDLRLLSARVLATPHPEELVEDAALHARALDMVAERLLDVAPEQRRDAMQELYDSSHAVQTGRTAADRIASYAAEHC